MDTLTLKIPATTANLACGFDAVGCALSLYNELTFTKGEGKFYATGCRAKYADETNLGYIAYSAAMKKMGLPNDLSHLHENNSIPTARGLGSSAAMITGGVAAANILHGSPLSDSEMLTVCTEIEGHPDNVAPALFGGLCAAFCDGEKAVYEKYTVSENLRFIALIPNFELSTENARRVLPDSYTRKDAVYNLSHLAVLLRALEKGDTDKIRYALSDRIHQPYRKSLIPGYDALEDAALSLGAAGFCISGAGPTLLVIADREFPNASLEEKISSLGLPFKVLPLDVVNKGII